jgi:hypothetical protein
MEPLLAKKYSIYLYNSGHLFLLSFLYALHRKHYQLAIVPGSIFLTSIQYWKNPTYSFRRDLDIVVVHTSIGYQHYMAYNAKYANLHFVIYLTAAIFFPISIYYYNKKNYWLATFLHMTLHILSNSANIILYSGYINSHSSYSNCLFK